MDRTTARTAARTTLTLLLATAGLSALPASSQADSYAGWCSLDLPRTVVVDQPVEHRKGDVGGPCIADQNVRATWVATGPSGSTDTLTFQERDGLRVSVPMLDISARDAMGTYAVTPVSAVSTKTGATYHQSSESVRVKLGTHLTVDSSHSGSWVTLRARVTRYDVTADAYRPYSGATVRFYARQSDGSWALRTTRTTQDGATTAALWSSVRDRDWKVVVSETATSWGASRILSE